MSIKDQLNKLKDNWFLLIIIVLAFGFFTLSSPISSIQSNMIDGMDMAFEESAIGLAASKSMIGRPPTSSFAPEVENRKITRTSRVSTEVDHGSFDSQELKLKSAIKSTNSLLLNENVNKISGQRSSYKRGSYTIKVELSKYDKFVSLIKNIGEIQSFSENANDVTDNYLNLEEEISVERERLKRFQLMFNQAKDVSDKIELNDRIFDQERRIKYLDQSIENLDDRIDYTSVYFTLNEKRNDFDSIVLVKFSDLIKNLVRSLNGLLNSLFSSLPYAIIAIVVIVIFKFFKKKK